MDLKALWNYKGKEFSEAWQQMDNAKRTSVLDEVRKNVAYKLEVTLDVKMPLITRKAAIMYCPEINTEDLLKDNGKPVLDMMDLCYHYTDDISKLDSFTSVVAMQMKAKKMKSRKALITIVST
jgi:hypothetical protein